MSAQSMANRVDFSRRLARALVASGYSQEETIAPYVAEAGTANQALGTVLIARGVLAASVVVGRVSELSGLPALDLFSDPPTAEALRLLPPHVSAGYGAISIRVVGPSLLVAFSEPPDPADVQSLSAASGREVVAAVADPVVIGQVLQAHGVEPAPRGDTAVVDGPSSMFAVSAPGANGAAQRNEDATLNHARGPLENETPPLHVNDLLRYAVSIGASDLHLTAGLPPSLRVHGALRPMENMPALDPTELRELIFGILPQAQRERFEAEHELDTSHSIADVGRFRVNLALQRGTVAVALRPIPHEIPQFEDLGLPDGVRRFAELRRGLVLVTGPTGSGKSTSLASLIDIINRTKPLHIVTVEDPIEFLHQHKRSVISQREVGSDTESFPEALRRVLRQDPDVILVGELRDLVTISTALTAAETGHLVFGTVHTLDAPSTIDRIIDVFPPSQQEQIRIQLAAALQGVVTQQLVPTQDGQGRAVAAEVLVGTAAISNLIRGAKTHQIYSLMQTGGQLGMQTMDQSLALLVRQGVVTEGVALDRCRSEEDFRNHLHHV